MSVKIAVRVCVSYQFDAYHPQSSRQFVELYTTYVPWVLRVAPRASFLMNIDFEKHFEDDLADMRAALNLEPPPRPL